MRKINKIFFGTLLGATFLFAGIALAAPHFRIEGTLIPVDSIREVGTSTRPWFRMFTNSLAITGITGSTQCLHVDTNGLVTGTGSDCGTGAGGVFPFTPSAAGNSTSTTLIFGNGFVSSGASSTISDLLHLDGSVNASSTFHVTGNSSFGTILAGIWNGTAIGDAYLTKSGNWTGTFDGQEGTYYLDRANHTGTQGASTISAGTFGVGLFNFPGSLNASTTLHATGNVNFGAGIFGANIADCTNPTTGKILYNASTGVFSCGADQDSGVPVATSTFHYFDVERLLAKSLSATSTDLTLRTFGTGKVIRANQSFNASSTLHATGNALFGASVGIATGTPANTLSVVGQGYITGGLGIGVSTTTSGGDLEVSGHSWFSKLVTAVSGFIVNTLFRLPSNGTLATAGDMTLDTTTNQLQYHDGTNIHVAIDEFDRTLIVASTTPDLNYKMFKTGTTTFKAWQPYRAMTLDRFYCDITRGTHLFVRFGDGTASTTYANCTPSGVEASSLTNNTFISREAIYVEVGGSIGSADGVTITSTWKETSD